MEIPIYPLTTNPLTSMQRLLVFSYFAGVLSSGTAYVLASDADAYSDGDALSLLQLKTSKVSHNSTSNSNAMVARPGSGHPFGCTGRSIAENHVICSMYGDPHVVAHFPGGKEFNLFGIGWHWLAKSKDGSFQAQGFVRHVQPGQWATLTHVVMKFGDNMVFIDRDRPDGDPRLPWAQTYYINGKRMDESKSPLEIGSLYWASKKGAGQLEETAADTWTGAETWGDTNRLEEQAKRFSQNKHDGSSDEHRLSCWEMGQVSVWTTFEDWLDEKNLGPWRDPMLWDLEGSPDFLDTEFPSACQGSQVKVEPADMLVTVAQNDKVCSDNGVAKDECAAPDPPVEPLTAEQLCEKNAVDITHAQDLCSDQKVHGDTIFADCIYDVCCSVDEKAQLLAVAGAEMEEATRNSEAKCAVSTESCVPCTLCMTATEVDLSNVVQNNLGGVGPDAGAEEIRYSNAITLDGQALDVVLTVESEYKTPKPSKNGARGAFGIFTMKAKQSTDFKFTFVDSGSGSPVAVKDLALTFYDLDEGKAGKQKESISACNAAEVYTTSDTELIPTVAGSCRTYASSTKGTGKDNPQRPDELTRTQAARSVTFEFHSRASITFTAAVGATGRSPRPVMFSFNPQVACGASDSDVRCDK